MSGYADGGRIRLGDLVEFLGDDRGDEYEVRAGARGRVALINAGWAYVDWPHVGVGGVPARLLRRVKGSRRDAAGRVVVSEDGRLRLGDVVEYLGRQPPPVRGARGELLSFTDDDEVVVHWRRAGMTTTVARDALRLIRPAG
jgi:hypothetical protein